MAGFSVFTVTFTGVNLNGIVGPATISVPGVKSGDIRIAQWQTQSADTDGYMVGTPFSYVVENDDEIVQKSGNGSAEYNAVFLRFS